MVSSFLYPYDKDMFVARAQGSSMEPKIHSGDLLVFRATQEAARPGKIVLAQYRGAPDPETGGSFTVKTYSEKTTTPEKDSRRILLKPLNPDFASIEIPEDQAEDFRVIAEYLFTISHAGQNAPG